MDCVKRLLVGSFLVLLGSLACVQVSFAQANPLNFGNNFFVTGDYVVAGAQGMTTNFSNGYAIGTFTIPDANPGIHGQTSVPVGAEIMAAILYWQTVEKAGTIPGQPGTGENGFFRPLIHSGPPAPGYPITGVPLPGHNAVSWSQGGCSQPSTDKNTRTYRANVLGALPQDVNGNILANGQFEVRLPSVGPSTPLTLGASLVIVYRILSPNVPLNSIVIYDGAFGQSDISLNMTQTVQGFYDADHKPVSKLTLIAGAGKSKESQSVSLNNIVLPSHSGHGLPPFPGYYGSWDNPTWTFGNPNYPEIANPVLEDSANATIQVVPSGGGCVSWGTVILSTTVKNSDGDGLLNVWKAPKTPNDPHRPGYCDASVSEGGCTQGDANWVDLPQAALGHKDIFVQLDYICSTATGADKCTPTNGTDYSFDPRPSGAIDMVTKAFAAQGITLHVNPPTNMPDIHAIQEQACTDITGPPLQLCAFPNQPGVVTWKGGYSSIKNQLIDPDSPLDLNDCATSPAAADCIPRFQHGRKDSWHYVLFAHAVGTTQWRLQDGTLTSVKQTGNNVVFTTSTAIGTLTNAGYDAHGNPILDPTCSYGRVTIVGAGTNSNLNGTYCVQKQTNPGDTSFTITIGGNATNAQYILSTDPNLSVAIGQVNSASGSSDVGGEDSLIALGLWGDPTSITSDGQEVSTMAGTFMHELGHSIGLTHGGFYYDAPGSYVPTIETNCKPNHLSVMNYMFQVDLLDNGTGTNVPDYSGQTLTTLNEAAAAANPLTSPVPKYLSTSWYDSTSDIGGSATPAGSHCDGSPIGPLEPQMTRVTRPIGSLSWKAGQDINFDGGTDSTNNPNTNEKLRGYDDWIPTVTNTGTATTGVDLRQIGATGALSVTSEQLFNDGGQKFGGGGQKFGGGGQKFGGGGQSFAGGGQKFGGGGQKFAGGGEIDEKLVNTVTRSPRSATATEDVSPRLIHLSWLPPTFGQIGSYKVYRSAHGGAFTVIATISGNPPATTYTDTVTCDPGGYQYFITAVLGSNSPNPGQESAPSNTVPASGQNAITGCYALNGGSTALSVTGFASPAAGASFTQGDKVAIAVPVTDDFYPTNGTVPVAANKALVAIGPLPNDGNCPSIASVPVFLNYPGGPGAYPQPYTILSSGGSGLTNNNNQITFSWDTTNFNAGCYVLEADFDSQQVDRTEMQVTIFESDNTPHILNTTLPTATAGIPYGNTIQESGGAPGALTWSITAGTFSPGLSIGLHSGTISGTPTTAGNYNFTVQVMDSLGNIGTRVFTMKVLIFVSDSAPPTITPAIPTATAGIPYSNTIQQYGAVGTPAWSITAGAVPPGMAFNTSNGTVSGTPTTAGNYNFTVQVTDSAANMGSLAFTSKVLIFVSDAAPLVAPPYVTPNLPTATAGIPYSNTLYQTGATGAVTWNFTGTPPSGLSFNANGTITGTPTTAGTHNFTAQAMDSQGNTGSLAFTLKVLIFVSYSTAPILNSSLPNATAGIPFSDTIQQSGAVGGVTWSITSGALPPGSLTLTTGNGGNGVLAGTPSTAGTYNFTAQAMDSQGNTGSLAFTLTVLIYASDSQPFTTTTTLPNAVVGSPYSNTVYESGGVSNNMTPFSWTIVAGSVTPGGGSTLPGIAFQANAVGVTNGTLSGTPTSAGTFTFTAMVTDSAGNTGTQNLAITVFAPASAPYGLVSWYPFEGNPNDLEKINNGNMVGTPQFVPGEVDNGLKPGPQLSGSLITVPDSPTLALTQFTIGAWVRVDNLDNVETMQIVWKGDQTAGDLTTPYSLSVLGSANSSFSGGATVVGTAGPGKVLVILTDGTNELDLVSTNALPLDGKFHYVALTADGQKVNLYIDGVLDPNTPASETSLTLLPFMSANPLQIGGIQSGPAPGNNFDGVIDELQIWNRPLTAAEVSGIFNTVGEYQPAARPAGLVSWWPAEGGYTDIISGNNGTPSGGVGFAPGEVGQAFSFSGGSAEIVVADNANLDVGQITIEAWVKPTTSGHGRPILQKRSSVNVGGYTFETTDASDGPGPANGLQFAIWISGTQYLLQTPANVLTISAWQHVAATFDGTTMNIYVNGILQASQAASGAIDTDNADSLVMGLNVTNAGYDWNGFTDEVSLYNRALTSAEIQSIVNAGGAGKAKP